jgi:hypothetical protein
MVELIKGLEKQSRIDQMRQSVDFIQIVKLDAITLPLPPPFGHPAPHEAPQRHQRLVGEAIDQLVELLTHFA